MSDKIYAKSIKSSSIAYLGLSSLSHVRYTHLNFYYCCMLNALHSGPMTLTSKVQALAVRVQALILALALIFWPSLHDLFTFNENF